MTTQILAQTPPPAPSSYREKTLPLTGLRWSTDGRLLVTSDETAASLNRRAFSVSAGQAIAQCQAKWLASQVVPREDDPLQAAPLGVHAHAALESFYRDVPAAERTREALEAHVRQVFLSPEFRADQEKLDPDGRITQELKVMDFALGVLELEDPTQVNVIEVERRFKAVPLNTFLNLNGFIDRVERLFTGESEEVEITDYKTGKYEKFNPAFGNRDEKADQIRIYGRGYEKQTGIRPTRGQLLYTGARARTEVDMSVEATDDSVQWLTDQYQAQQRAVEAREFTTNPGPLCAWCPLVNACPVGQIGSPKKWTNADKFALELSNGVALTEKRRAWMLKDAVSLRKAVAAASGQFSPDQLGIAGSREFKPAPVVPPLVLAALERHEAEEAAATAPAERARIETSPPPAPLIQEIHAMTMTAAPQQAAQQMPAQAPQQQMTPRPEGRPFDEIVNGPGGVPLLNLNSYAATGVFGLVGLAGESLTKAGVAAPTQEQILALARVFARMVQRAEAGITSATSWSSGANTRIRGLLRSVLEQRPLPVGAGPEAWNVWYQTNGPYLMVLAQSAMTVWDDNAISVELLMESLGTAATAQKGGPFA
ncbi:hypothetical protein C5E06_09960 [Pseudoclavibacter sp. RFBI5]|uniref:RecB family exonuclease n=1 Tax=Pseudoclavibacter sp. RFBI5 TaxID=2080578 RepID=UPI000CE834ED|nr:PD-(D/E)XK nuclease family protein [Pseudoclavibacter sp. RFBI5]PPG02765.1 hypothetical protein C5E06_09960 [Pseudoclavibacter sp. RFBI5]